MPLIPAILLACRPSADGGPPPGTTTSPPTGGSGAVTTPTPTGDTGATGPTGDTGPPQVVVDCATIPTLPTAFREVPGARGYHDVVFDPDGNIVGQSVTGDLLEADYAGNVAVWVPNVGTLQQMVWLPDGDLAVASETYGISRVAPNGSSIVINGDIRPYGLVLGPDEMLYSADQTMVHRIDPVSGAATVIVPAGALPRGGPRVLNFDLGYTKLLMGTLSGTQGRLYAVDLDANLDPTGLPYEFASGVGTGSYHDGLGVDLCGYLYVPDYNTSALWRISPDGTLVQELVDAGFFGGQYGHGLEWGNGLSGWLTDAIYLPQPYNGNRVQEVVIGVPSREWTGGVAINLP